MADGPVNGTGMRKLLREKLLKKTNEMVWEVLITWENGSHRWQGLWGRRGTVAWPASGTLTGPTTK